MNAVVGDAVGELDCDSLELVEGAPALTFRVSSTEVKCYTFTAAVLYYGNAYHSRQVQPRHVFTTWLTSPAT